MITWQTYLLKYLTQTILNFNHLSWWLHETWTLYLTSTCFFTLWHIWWSIYCILVETKLLVRTNIGKDCCCANSKFDFALLKELYTIILVITIIKLSWFLQYSNHRIIDLTTQYKRDITIKSIDFNKIDWLC